jgi:chorismate mutase
MTAIEIPPSAAASGPAFAEGAAARPVAGVITVPTVLTGRERIDALDMQIAELVLRRVEVSRQIQAARIAEGGRRVDLRRETEIIGRYSGALGRPGTQIAMALLELSRGRA